MVMHHEHVAYSFWGQVADEQLAQQERTNMTTKNPEAEISEEISEQTPIVDTTWSDLTKEERQDKFTSAHKGISDEDVQEAWTEIGTVNGIAKELGCSKVNARRRLEKLGLKKAPPSRQKSVKPVTEEEIVAELVASQLTDN